MEKKKIKSMMFFQNGNVAVFNNKGNQISEFQGSYVLDLIEKIEKSGFKVDKTTEIILPSGYKVEYMPEYHNLKIND
uniref:Uncharacterized protein n=1 Tax=viral metagenome TaxID=1070528 RepID=A0A6H1ZDT0_9ZZZZ